MTREIDPQNYTQLPRFDVARGTALTTSLVSALDPGMPQHVQDLAKAMIAARDELVKSWCHEPTPTVSDRRPADLAVDRAWAACHTRLKAYAGLRAEKFPKAERAAELLQIIFPEGLTFLKLPYNQEWAESEKRLQMIEAEGMRADIDAIAGPEFLVEIEDAHIVYGEVLGITKANAGPPAPVRAQNLRNLRKAMSRYVFGVLSLVTDAASSDAARAALRPIDELRSHAQARRGSPSQTTPDADNASPLQTTSQDADDASRLQTTSQDAENSPLQAINARGDDAPEQNEPTTTAASDSADAASPADSDGAATGATQTANGVCRPTVAQADCKPAGAP